MKRGLSEIVVVLDRSGSMSSTKDDAEGGLRAFVQKQKEVPGECVLTFYRFDDVVERVFKAKPLAEIADGELKLEPRNCTALLDAMERAIDEVGARLNGTPDESRPEHVYVVIVTDGMENASKADPKTVFDKVTLQRDTYKWQFVFIGANQDAIASASKLGIGAKYAVNYRAGHVGTKNAYMVMAESISASRATGQNVCFTAQQRAQTMSEDDLGSQTPVFSNRK